MAEDASTVRSVPIPLTTKNPKELPWALVTPAHYAFEEGLRALALRTPNVGDDTLPASKRISAVVNRMVEVADQIEKKPENFTQSFGWFDQRKKNTPIEYHSPIRPKTGTNPDDPIYDDSIQFPRLIAETLAVDGFTPEVIAGLAAKMKMEPYEVRSLLVRAQHAFQHLREKGAYTGLRKV